MEFDDVESQKGLLHPTKQQSLTEPSSIPNDADAENEYASVASFPIPKADQNVLMETVRPEGGKMRDVQQNAKTSKLQSVKKRGFTKKEYTVLPGIAEKHNEKTDESDIRGCQQSLLYKLPSLGLDAPEIPIDEINSDYLEDLPPPPDTLLFNKIPILPAIQEVKDNHTTESASIAIQSTPSNINDMESLYLQDIGKLEFQYDKHTHVSPMESHGRFDNGKGSLLADTYEGNHDSIAPCNSGQHLNDKVIFYHVTCMLNRPMRHLVNKQLDQASPSSISIVKSCGSAEWF